MSDTETLERERWERMRTLHRQYENMRSEAARRNALRGPKEKEIKLRTDDGTAARLLTVFGEGGSDENAWWTEWRPA